MHSSNRSRSVCSMWRFIRSLYVYIFAVEGNMEGNKVDYSCVWNISCICSSLITHNARMFQSTMWNLQTLRHSWRFSEAIKSKARKRHHIKSRKNMTNTIICLLKTRSQRRMVWIGERFRSVKQHKSSKGWFWFLFIGTRHNVIV